MITVPPPASFPRLAAAVVIALSGCGGDSVPTYHGYVEGEYLYLAAPQAGYLKSVDTRGGSRVARGQALFAIAAATTRRGSAPITWCQVC